MTLTELLKAQGLTDEQITAVSVGMKANGIYTAGEENLDIRYGKLKTEFENLTAQNNEAQGLIENLKKATKGSDELQAKIGTYEGQIAELQKSLEIERKTAALKVALLEAKVTDIDYMTFKVKEKGEIELDENGKIKGWDDRIAGLKTQFPQQFESSSSRRVEERKLETGDNGNGGLSRAELMKKSYAERARLYQENPDGFMSAMTTKN